MISEKENLFLKLKGWNLHFRYYPFIKKIVGICEKETDNKIKTFTSYGDSEEDSHLSMKQKLIEEGILHCAE